MTVELLTPDEAARALRLAPKTLRNLRHTGGGPPFVTMGDGPGAHVRYPRRDLERWVADHTFTRTHEAAS